MVKINTEKLIAARNKLKLSQTDLAQKLNIRYETYGLKERNAKKFFLDEYVNLIKFLNENGFECNFLDFIIFE